VPPGSPATGLSEQEQTTLAAWLLRTRNDESGPDFTRLVTTSESDSSFRVRKIVTVCPQYRAIIGLDRSPCKTNAGGDCATISDIL
jgi:hypothetical protein